MELLRIPDSSDLIKTKAMEKKVLLVPGFEFFPNPRKTPYVRASFSTATPQEIDEALARLAELVKEARAVAGEEVPKSPFPIRLNGVVSKGFGRGSRELGIPTGKDSQWNWHAFAFEAFADQREFSEPAGRSGRIGREHFGDWHLLWVGISWSESRWCEPNGDELWMEPVL